MSAPARIVVGYTADESGADALALAARLAAATEALLEVVMVLPIEARGGVVPPDTGYERYVKERSRTWLAEASATLDDDIAQSLHIRYAESFAEGLIDGRARVRRFVHRRRRCPRRPARSHARRLGRERAAALVGCPGGARARGRARDRTLAGSDPHHGAIGTRAGSSAVLEASVRFARSAHAPLRLLSLVPIDLPSGMDEELAAPHERRARRRGARRGAARAAGRHRRDRVTATGATIEESVRDLEWHAGEVVLVGSSRLATPRHLFLGSTAAKMLRELPVPLIVVPRTTAP